MKYLLGVIALMLLAGCGATAPRVVYVPVPVETVRERTVYVRAAPCETVRSAEAPHIQPPSERPASRGNSLDTIRALREAARCYDPPAGSALEAECRSRRRGDSLDVLEEALEDYNRP